MKKKGYKIIYKNWICEWLEDKHYYVKYSTYANYACIIYNHLIPAFGNYRLSDINNKMLQEFIINKYRVGRKDKCGGLSDKTVKNICTVIKLSLKSAISDNLIDYINLDFKYPKKNINNRIHIFSKNEQKEIVDYCMNNKNIKNAVILLALYSGLRIGEVCALKWEDIDLKKNLILINKTVQRIYIKEERISKIVFSTPKTKNANRIVPINSEFSKYLSQFKTNDGNYVLSNGVKWVEPRTFRRYYYKVLDEIGVNKFNFHSLRHTFATNCIRLGVDYKTVSELLGHASVNITLNIYVHPQMSEKKRCINLIYKDNKISDNA